MKAQLRMWLDKVITNSSRIVKLTALFMCAVLCINSLGRILQTKAYADMNSYRNQIGTLSGINSPLLRDEVTAEKFEPWELEVFAIFMSNFAVPLIDSMDSAFGYTKEYGSKGRGLEALKFTTGGDIVAGGILQNMVKYVLDTCAQTEVPIYSCFDLYRNGVKEVGQQTTQDFFKMDSNKAKFADLVPIIAGLYYSEDWYNKLLQYKVGEPGSPLKTNMTNTYVPLQIGTSTGTVGGTSETVETTEPTVSPTEEVTQAPSGTPSPSGEATPTVTTSPTEPASVSPTQTTNASPGRTEANRITPTPKKNQTEALPAREAPCALSASTPTEAPGGNVTTDDNRNKVNKNKVTPTPIKYESNAAPGTTTPTAEPTIAPTTAPATTPGTSQSTGSTITTDVQAGTEVFRSSWVLSYFGQDGDFGEAKTESVNRMIPTVASLPTFYIEGEGGAAIPVFSLADGWDAQIWAVCMNYAVIKAAELDNKSVDVDVQTTAQPTDPNNQANQTNQTASTANQEQLYKLFTGTCDYPLSMDACGNIIVTIDNRKIIAIPACLNRNLRRDHAVNLFVSAILNDICCASDINIMSGLSNNIVTMNGVDDIDGDYNDNYGTIGTGLALDTSTVLIFDGDDVTGVQDVGLARAGNLVVYNTSDTIKNNWSPKETCFERVKEVAKDPSISYNNDLCISLIGGPIRMPSTNIDLTFGCENGVKELMLENMPRAEEDIISQSLKNRWTGTDDGTSSFTSSIGNYPIYGISMAAQVCQMWGVSVGDTISEVNHDFKKNPSDNESIDMFNSIAVHTSGTLLFSNKTISAFAKVMKDYWPAMVIGAAAGLVVGVVAGVAAGSAIGVGAAALGIGFIASNPVGWVVGVCIAAGAVIGGILAWAFGDDRPDIAFEEKIVFGMNLSSMHGKYLNYGTEEYKTECNYETYMIDTATEPKDLAKLLLTSRQTYAAALASGKVPGFKPVSADAADKIYDIILDDGDIDDDDLFAEGQVYPRPHRNDSDVEENIAKSVATIASVNKDISDVKAYMTLNGSTDLYDTYASVMYLDTLKFYGFGDSTTTPDKVLNTDLFKAVNSRLTGDTTGLYNEIFGDDGLTEEQKLQKIQDYTYLALTPESKGVEYRNQLLVTGWQRWIANEYNNICYGDGAVGANKTGTNGFLAMTGYSENFMTKWIVENWNKVLIITIYISMVLIFLLGAIKGKKLGWIVANILSTTVLLILLPTTGEIAPYVSDKIVQEMFQSGAQYWAINEGIEDDYLQKQYTDSELSENTIGLIRQASITTTSNTLMLKHDISKKIMSTNKTDETELLRLASTRWMLSSLMRQISADNPDELYDYVYNTVGDTRWALRDLFLYYRNGPAVNLKVKYGNRQTIESKENLTVVIPSRGTTTGGKWADYENLAAMWTGFEDLAPDGTLGLHKNMDDHNAVIYSTGAQTWKSPSLTNDLVRANSDHLVFTYLPRIYVGSMTTADVYNEDGVVKSDDKTLLGTNRGSDNDNAGKLASFEGARKKYPGSKGDDQQINTKVLDFFQKCIVASNGREGTTVESVEGTVNARSIYPLNRIGTDGAWRTYTRDIIRRMEGYHDYGALQEFGFLHMTEDLSPYFYLVSKDLFSWTWSEYSGVPTPNGNRKDTYGLGALATELLGYIDTDTVDKYTNKPIDYTLADGTTVHGKEGIRRNIMIDHDISKIAGKNLTRDFLDLEYLFTNYVPYMAEIMFITGGEDGTNGRLHDATMQQLGYDIYGDSEASWFFRSNWVIKLLSSSNYSKGATIRDSKGNEFTVEHQAFPLNYRIATQNTRPMVFSEAQMFAYGLTEEDLSAFELACVETNREVCRTWEKLVNYVNTDGISAEIIEEQMALEAAMAFNRNFVDDNFISAEMALYPTTFDLRSISFDSVMKLLVISDNYNSASLTQHAIYSVMAEDGGGTFGGICVLVLAWFAQVLIPLIRNVALGIIFYCSMICAFYNILNDSKDKAAATVGGGVLGMCYAAVTICYYALYWFVITRNSPDLILNENGFNIGTSKIMFKVILLIAASVAYAIITIKFFIVRVLFRDIKHMGLNIMKQYASTAYSKLKRFGNKIKSKFGSKKAAEDNRMAAANDVAEARGGAGSGSEEVKVTGGEMTLANTRKNPVPVLEVNDPDSATYIEAGDGEDSGFVEDEKEEEKANAQAEASSNENSETK